MMANQKKSDAFADFKNSVEGIAHEFRLSVGELIIEGMRDKPWSQKQLADALGVSEPLVSRLLNGDHNWTSKSVAKVMHALGIRVRAHRAGRKPVAAAQEIKEASTSEAQRPVVIIVCQTGLSTTFNMKGLTIGSQKNIRSTAA